MNTKLLQRLSDGEVETRLKSLVQQERLLLNEVLLYIQILESRRIYLDRGYSSCFLYLVEVLGYSTSAAMRRLEAARLLKDLPAVSEQIESGSLNLSQIGELSRAIKEKEKTSALRISITEKQQLVERILDKTTVETQKELAQALELELKTSESVRHQKDGSVQLTLTLSAGQFEKLVECRNLAAAALFQSSQDVGLAAVVEHLSDQFLKKKKGSKDSRDEKSQTTKNSESPDGIDRNEIAIAASAMRKANKTLTPKTRRFVLQRDQCCQHQDKESGKVCGSRFGLEVDHIQPRWAGENHDPENLQALCHQHNGKRYRDQAQIRFL